MGAALSAFSAAWLERYAGFMLVLLSYIWCDEYWMAAYNVRDYAATAENIPRIVRFHFASVALGIVLIAAAIVYRKFLSGAPEGFPWYFVYLVCASLIPSAGFFPDPYIMVTLEPMPS